MIIERMQHYVFPVTTVNPAGSIQEGLNLQTDDDAPFRLYGIAVWTNNVAGGAFDGQTSLRFMRPDGRLIQRIFTPANSLAPGNSYAGTPTPTGANPNQALISPITPNIIFPPQSVITVDLQTLNPATKTPSAVIVFVGTKIYKPGDIWQPTYPEKWTARPYTNSLIVPNVTITSGPILNQPFIVEKDADFVFQMGAYADSDSTTGGLPMSLADLGFRMRDAFGKGYSNDYVPIALLFPFMNAALPGFVYPEIYVPASQLLLFDFKYLWT